MTDLIVTSGVKDTLNGYQVSKAFYEARNAKQQHFQRIQPAEPRPMTTALSNHVISNE